MFNETHNLAAEMPEFKEEIHELKVGDTHFAKLFEEYDEVDKELHRIASEIETPSDDVIEQLKKKRIALKDELYSMLKKHAA
jgi:uncharacterized protein YdcH (DUF465 family)